MTDTEAIDDMKASLDKVLVSAYKQAESIDVLTKMVQDYERLIDNLEARLVVLENRLNQ